MECLCWEGFRSRESECGKKTLGSLKWNPRELPAETDPQAGDSEASIPPKFSCLTKAGINSLEILPLLTHNTAWLELNSLWCRACFARRERSQHPCSLPRHNSFLSWACDSPKHLQILPNVPSQATFPLTWEADKKETQRILLFALAVLGRSWCAR